MNTMSNGYNRLEIFELALQQAPISGKNQKEIDFGQSYLLIEQHLARKVPQKVILEIFNNAYGYTLHPPRFRKMLDDERKRRAEAGDVAVCTACGQQLPSGEKATEEFHDQEGQ